MNRPSSMFDLLSLGDRIGALAVRRDQREIRPGIARPAHRADLLRAAPAGERAEDLEAVRGERRGRLARARDPLLPVISEAQRRNAEPIETVPEPDGVPGEPDPHPGRLAIPRDA